MAIDYLKMDHIEKELVAEAQVLLKKEWIRVRKGEAAYRFAKIGAFIIVFGGLLTLAILAVKKISN